MRETTKLASAFVCTSLLVLGALLGRTAAAQQADSSITPPPAVTADEVKSLSDQNEANKQKGKMITVKTRSGASRNICPGAYQDVPYQTDYSSETFYACKPNRGTTTIIPESVVIKYCSDTNGCIVRIGMHDWDDTERVASRHFLFFYNPVGHTWRAEAGDTQGTNINGITEHVNNSWACYFTDGKYANWQNQGDNDSDFGLLSWNQYNADCFLTFMK